MATDPLLQVPAILLVRPEQTVAEGCPVLTKVRHVAVSKGVRAVVEWGLRDRRGDPLNLAAYVDNAADAPSSLSVSHSIVPGGKVVVRLVSCDEKPPLAEVDAIAVNAAEGLVRFRLPGEIADLSGIYRLELGVQDAAGNLLATERGLLSVERGNFGDILQDTGPPTLGEIRMALRDSAEENTLLQTAEFSADEIVFSIARPIAEWNETPPPVRRYTCATFPWREHWLKGIIGHLLATAGHHYVRNKLQASHGGLTVNDKDKDAAYFSLAQQYREEWRQWMLHKKMELNVRETYGGLSSSYTYGYW